MKTYCHVIILPWNFPLGLARSIFACYLYLNILYTFQTCMAENLYIFVGFKFLVFLYIFYLPFFLKSSCNPIWKIYFNIASKFLYTVIVTSLCIVELSPDASTNNRQVQQTRFYQLFLLICLEVEFSTDGTLTVF